MVDAALAKALGLRRRLISTEPSANAVVTG
jgi:hypothetical protein